MGEIASLTLSSAAQLFNSPWGKAVIGLLLVASAVQLVRAFLR